MVAESIGGQVSGAVARRRRATLLVYTIKDLCYNSVRLLVCSLAIRAKTTAEGATKLSMIIKWGSRSVLHGLRLPVLHFLKKYPSISGFSFTADSHFINYHG